jgi:hypothetical protein
MAVGVPIDKAYAGLTRALQKEYAQARPSPSSPMKKADGRLAAYRADRAMPRGLRSGDAYMI